MAIPRLGEIANSKYRTLTAAAEAMGIQRGNLSNMVNHGDPKTLRIESIERIEKAFPEYNVDWVLERSEIKLKSDFARLSPVKPAASGFGIDLGDGRTIGDPRSKSQILPSVNQEQKGVPYFDVDFIGGFDLVFNNQVQPSYYIDFLPFNDVDAWINVTGKSMGPLIAHGDIVALKKIDDWQSFLLQGEIYAIITSNGFRTIKILGKGENEDEFMLIPYNKSEEFKPQPIPKSIITHVFKVKGAIKKFF
jgi:signal peptidase I